MKADFLRYHIEDLLSFLFENKINEKIKNISTHTLTVLIMSVILHLEQRKGNKKNRRCRKRNRSSQKAFL